MRSSIFAALALGVALAGAADDLPKKITQQERETLEERAEELTLEGLQALEARHLDRAEKALRKALGINRALYPGRDHPEVAGGTDRLATVLLFQKAFPEAEKLLRESLAMRRRLHKDQEHAEVVEALKSLAAGLVWAREFTKAKPFLVEALAMQRGLHGDKDDKDVAQFLSSSAYLYGLSGSRPEAAGLFREALAMRRRLHMDQDHQEIASDTVGLAMTLQELSKFSEAESLLREALAMRRRLHKNRDHAEIAETLNSLAKAVRDRGRAWEAEALLSEALAMRRRLHKGQDHEDVAEALNSLGSLLNSRGKFGEAEDACWEGLGIQLRLHPKEDHPLTARLKRNLAQMLYERGRVADGERMTVEAAAMRHRMVNGRDNADLARSLADLGMLAENQGEYADAETFYRDAWAMQQRLNDNRDHPDAAAVLANLAHVLHTQGRTWAAELMARRALAMRRRLFDNRDHPDVADSLNNLAYLVGVRGDYAAAERLAKDGLLMVRRLYGDQDHPKVAGFLNNLAHLLRHRGNYAAAENCFRDALRMNARLASEYAAAQAEGEALMLAKSFPDARNGFLSNAALNRTEPAAVYAEVWASKANVGRVAEGRAFAARVAASQNEVIANFVRRLAEMQLRRQELLLAPIPTDPKSRRDRDEELGFLERKIGDDVKALPLVIPAVSSIGPALERLKKLERSTAADLQAVLPPDTVFVDFLAYARSVQDPKKPGAAGEKWIPNYAAFVVTRGGIRWLDLGPAKPIDEAVRLWREAITTTPYAVPRDIPDKLRELVWAKVRAEFPAEAKIIYLSPDAALTGVPWAALPGDVAGTIVLEEFAVAVVPHGPALLGALWPRPPQADAPERLLAVGGVGFDQRPDQPRKAVALALATGGDPLIDPDKPRVWKNLDNTRWEIEQIARWARNRKLKTRLLTDARASVEQVLAELPRVRYAHFATHGFFADPQFRSVLQLDPDLFRTLRGGAERLGSGVVNPMVLSGLVFAGANRADTPGRGILTGEALPSRDLSGLELVVLSACQTGLGDVAGGEGVFGLQRAFHVAGARNVVASLWKVPDAATAVLMAEFYKAHWGDNLSPVLALQKAQLAVYRAIPKKFAELGRGVGDGDKNFDVQKAIAAIPINPNGKNPPYVWAAFTLSGPGR